VQSKNASFGAYFYLVDIALNKSVANKTVWQGQCSHLPGFTLGINAMDKPISLLMNKHITTVDINDTIDKVEKIMDSPNQRVRWLSVRIRVVSV